MIALAALETCSAGILTLSVLTQVGVGTHCAVKACNSSTVLWDAYIRNVLIRDKPSSYEIWAVGFFRRGLRFAYYSLLAQIIQEKGMAYVCDTGLNDDWCHRRCDRKGSQRHLRDCCCLRASDVNGSMPLLYIRIQGLVVELEVCC